jgi:serine-type D-Ala-D-Ala carboxypeptidase/endopeptidase (penicillin-binding protein 4)
MRKFLILVLLLSSITAFSQKNRFEQFLSDRAMTNASVSFVVADADSGKILFSHNPSQNLIPGSIMKLVTSSAAIELLGPEYTFKTTVGYTGILNKRTGLLKGNIILSGGGDPALGSKYFSDHYKDFLSSWVEEIRKAGIRKIKGRVITNDSYYDYEPAAPRWLWEDLGAYYGAGVFGLSVFDNSCKITVKSSADSSHVELISIIPSLPEYTFTNRLKASGNKENWYIYMAPYSTGGWLSGSIPVSNDEYILDASIPDPPLLIASLLHERLESEGISISDKPSTYRLSPEISCDNLKVITITVSPLLSFIIDVLNKESVNLYAEHLVKELGKSFKNMGTAVAGITVLNNFLNRAGIDTTSFFIEDGSGLSSRNGLNSEGLVKLLIYMEKNGSHFPEFYSSLPDSGINGTLFRYFTDPVFESNLKAKSGSMTRVRSYAGYFTTMAGRHLVFCIMVNNFNGPSGNIITSIEEILKEIIVQN